MHTPAGKAAHPLTIVIKLGTSSICDEQTHQPRISILSGIVETVCRLRNKGYRVVIVSSGAVGVGLKRMNMESKPSKLSAKQALAAIGQGRLIALWDNLFGQLEQPIAQVLLTRGDISDRTRYLNARRTFSELLDMSVVPIVNENDTVSVSELRFGDNDTLSAITAGMVEADYLVLMTDVDGLYTSNPRVKVQRSDGSWGLPKKIGIVRDLEKLRKQVSVSTPGSSLGTGGMQTKLIAAELATAAGVATVIANAATPQNIIDIVERGTPALAASMHSAPVDSTPNGAEAITANGPLSSSKSEQLPELASELELDPPHTLFLPSAHPLPSRKWSILHGLPAAGTVYIDEGAYYAIARRNRPSPSGRAPTSSSAAAVAAAGAGKGEITSDGTNTPRQGPFVSSSRGGGGRLLPAGVVGVKGSWESGQAVRIVVRRRPRSGSGPGSDRGASETSPSPLSTPSFDRAEVVVSSVATSGPSPSISMSALDDDHHDSTSHERDWLNDGWELLEVARGLANYNSVEIDRIKGMKSYHIEKILGYVDSDYVTDQIALHPFAQRGE